MNIGLKQSNINDEIYTPIEALNSLLYFINLKNKIIFECCYGEGDLTNHLKNKGYTVYANKNIDFFKINNNNNFDIIITNPPYSNKRDFIAHAIQLNKPFAMLVPLTTLEGKVSNELFSKNEIQIIIPSKRINFLKHKGKKGSWFCVIWLCYKMNLPNQINFYKEEKL